MKESYLHYIWQSRQYDTHNLVTTGEEPVRIIKPGYAHMDAGPDFKQATISISDKLWFGHVEIHVKSSDWYRHNHHVDTAYDTTVLHVVFEHDQEVMRTDGSIIPCLELQHRMSMRKYKTYEALTNNSSKIPCDQMLANVVSRTKTMTIEALAVQRLSEKSETINHTLLACKNDWQYVLYVFIARAFGMRLNASPFAMLAKRLPPNLISKYRYTPNVIPALFFGVSGFLHPMFKEDYPKTLNGLFQFYKHKHGLQEIDPSNWSFLRLRPANFPTIRIAQLASLMETTTDLFTALYDHLDNQHINSLFNIVPQDYWINHYRFDEVSKPKRKGIGKSLTQSIIINAIVPVLYSYGSSKNNIDLQERCLQLLESTPKEQNKLVSYFESKNVSVENALQSQGVLHLHKKFCTFKLCVQCQIGHDILKKA